MTPRTSSRLAGTTPAAARLRGLWMAVQPRTAGEGTRTLDIQLGKLALYQLSYAREFP
jgi:hypothetical protein